MLGIRDLALFVVSGLVLNIAPGPDTLLIASRSAAQGWRAGSAAALGIGSGVLVHVLAAALGLSALVAASASAFLALKFAGAAYLVYVGVGLLRGAGPAALPGGAATRSAGAAATVLPLRRIYAQGFWTNVLNPKVAMFFLAFVPQFIAPDAASKPLAFIVLGAIFDVDAMLWCHLLAVATAQASRRLPARRWLAQAAGRVVGGLFVALGIRLALAARD